jgi:hypothetical protein
MPTAFTGGPYVDTTYLAASEAILIETFADILTAAGWIMVNKVGAWAAGNAVQPSNGTTVVVDSDTFTFKTSPVGALDVQIGGSAAVTAANFVAAVDGHSSTCGASYDSATNTVTVTYRTGGTFGNGVTLSGWITWTSTAMYGAPANQLWLGGYQFKTNFTGGGVSNPSVLPAIPCICYFFQADNFDWAWFSDGGGWPTTGTSFQFISADFSNFGAVHLMTAGPGAQLRVLASPAQFMMFRVDKDVDAAGGVLFGGSLYTNYDPTNPPAACWYAMGDSIGSPFFTASVPITNYSNFATFNLASEACFDETYCGPDNTQSVAQLSLRMPADAANFGQYVQWGGDPITCEPYIISGDTPTSGYMKYRGQIYDAITVGKPFPKYFGSAQLAEEYPWYSGSTLPSGVPKNRLSADFDQANWINVTDNFSLASLFVVNGSPVATLGNINYVYEGKA